jgi:NAD(P)-dependent dehydrogenase (short-subunit alcohol dehydrogenase family)
MKRKNRGRIVFISSESGSQIPAEMVHYGTTKTAQPAVKAQPCAWTAAWSGLALKMRATQFHPEKAGRWVCNC